MQAFEKPCSTGVSPVSSFRKTMGETPMLQFFKRLNDAIRSLESMTNDEIPMTETNAWRISRAVAPSLPANTVLYAN
jgi:hypothetical protein